MTKKEHMSQLANYMKELDFCMMTTADGNGTMISRPMSNNRNVEYDGDSYFFSHSDTMKVRHLQNSSICNLVYQTDDMLFIQVYGHADLLTSRSMMEPYWQDDLKAWFEDGLDTEGLCLIRVRAKTIRYWHKEKEGVIEM
ncbi:MAG: pyridoxamine 5'-phosphate oxidase family protein [Weeksellaceae bacterium]|nr:pyridoxamine 5'-phosphate oxidase family protein [Weeksellaceae bacterium]